MEDSIFDEVTTAILTSVPVAGEAEGTTSIVLDNVEFESVTTAIADSAGTTWLSGSVGTVDSFSMGNTYFENYDGSYTSGVTFSTPRNSLLTTSGDGEAKDPYFYQSKPQYNTVSSENFIQAKWFGGGRFKTQFYPFDAPKLK